MINNILAPGTSAIIDVFALVILSVFVVLGAVNGFAKTFVSIFGTLISFIFAALLCSSVAMFLENKFGFIQTVSNGLKGVLSGIFGEILMNTPLGVVSEEALTGNIALWLANIILTAKGNVNIPSDTTLNNIVAPIFGYYIVALIGFIALFIIIRIILFLVGELTKKAYKVKLVKAADISLGILLGFIRTFIFFSITLFIIKLIPLGFLQDLTVAIDSTIITKFFSNINIFELIIKTISSINVNGLLENIIAH